MREPQDVVLGKQRATHYMVWLELLLTNHIFLDCPGYRRDPPDIFRRSRRRAARCPHGPPRNGHRRLRPLQSFCPGGPILTGARHGARVFYRSFRPSVAVVSSNDRIREKRSRLSAVKRNEVICGDFHYMPKREEGAPSIDPNPRRIYRSGIFCSVVFFDAFRGTSMCLL